MQNQILLTWESTVEEYLEKTFVAPKNGGIKDFGERSMQFTEFVGSINSVFSEVIQDLLQSGLASREELRNSAVGLGRKYFSFGF